MMHNNDDISSNVKLIRMFQSLYVISGNGQRAYTHQNTHITLTQFTNRQNDPMLLNFRKYKTQTNWTREHRRKT